SMFFFSSRRRHTRSKRDWSSDVCSSDLGHRALVAIHAPRGPVAKPGSLIWLYKCQAGNSIRLPFFHSFLSDLAQWTAELADAARSEERRVGKEGRCGWWAHRVKEKNAEA